MTKKVHYQVCSGVFSGLLPLKNAQHLKNTQPKVHNIYFFPHCFKGTVQFHNKDFVVN